MMKPTYAKLFTAAAAALCVSAAVSAQTGTTTTGAPTLRPHGTEDCAIALPLDTIQLYKDAQFKDTVVQIDGATKGTKASQPLDLVLGAEDSLSAVRWNLPPGVVVIFFEDDTAKGEQFPIWGKGQTDSLAKFDFDNKASQWAWFYVGGVADPPAHVRAGLSPMPIGAETASAAVPQDSLHLFKSKNYAANEAVVANVTAQPMGQLNRLPQDLPDSLTSLRWDLPPGVVVMFFQDATGLKQRAAIWGKGQIADIDTWDFNDKVSRWAWYDVDGPGETIVIIEDDEPDAPPVVVTPPAAQKDAIALVATAMKPTELKVDRNDLIARQNPTGEGTFVYVPQRQFDGVERNVIWIVVDGKAYAVTGPAKLITPSLTAAADAPDATWARTGINKQNAEQDAIKIVFADH